MKSLRNLLFLLLAPAALFALRADQPQATVETSVERGRYLVANVGLCADCHTPRDEKGQFVMKHWLMGSALGFKPVAEMPWSPVAPPIAGLPSMTAEQARQFLMHGTRPDGSRPRPPMPAYRLNEADATDVVAYLKSLSSAAPAVAQR